MRLFPERDPRLRLRVLVAALYFAAAALAQVPAAAADWPMWRHDPARTAASPESLPPTLHLQWVREYSPLKPAFWQSRQERVQFDLGYEPVVLGKALFVGSSRNDSLTALDAETGAEKWRFYADGPVRLAPVAWEDKVYFGSDDGSLYCLAAASGQLQWKIPGAPSLRKVLGNERLISVWPARGGPVVDNGRIFFAAGVWPFEGIFVHALDARTGQSLWINDRLGSFYAEHPHAAMSFGGPSPQGYLLIHQGRLVLPSSRAFPAFLDASTGELLAFEFGHGGHGSRPGSWFVVGEKDGPLMVDPTLNTEMHDEGRQTIGQRAIRRQPGEALAETVVIGKETYRVKPGVAGSISTRDREFRFQDGYPGVEGTVHTMLVAGGRLFVVTRAGAIYCFGSEQVEPRHYPLKTQPLQIPDPAVASQAQAVLQATGQSEGYALVWGLGTGRLAEALVTQSELRVIAVDRDAAKIDAFRRRLDAAGLYGERIAAHSGNALEFGWPPYLANLILCEDETGVEFTPGEKFLETAYQALRPYGGVLCLKLSPGQHEEVAGFLKRPNLAGAQLRRAGDYSLVVRAGPLPGAANYAGQPNYDDLVKAPLGLLWFGDTFHHHKLFYKGVTPESGRGLPVYLRVMDGVMSYLVTEPYGAKPAKLTYPALLQKFNAQTHAAAFTDVYTGRQLATNAPATAAPETRSANSPPGISLARKNPITGAEEAREFVKNHGCDLVGADYGNLITMRSGTAAFYDKRRESGTINISGTRSGCRNSIIPACGVLNLPAWTGNCSCNYPVFTSLALVPMPESFEQWTAWGSLAQDGPIQRVGINFGAPGDRMSSDGTLWLDWPQVGGPSPDVRLQVTPETVQPFYRHSLWMKGGKGWPWVFASGIQGVRSVRIETMAHAPQAATFSVRWTGFVQNQQSETNTFHARSDGTFRLWIDGFPVLDSTRYKAGAAPPELTGRIFLEGGRKHTLHAEYVPSTGTNAEAAFAALSWSSPSRAKTVIPSPCLFTPDDRPGGLAGVYFANSAAKGPGLVQIDPQINFDWGRRRPALLNQPAVPAREQTYTVRLFFAEPEPLRESERVFAVKIQGQPVLPALDITKEAGGQHRGLLREFQGLHASDAVTLEFLPLTQKPPLICGIELIAENRR